MKEIIKKLKEKNIDVSSYAMSLSVEQLEKILKYASSKYYNSDNSDKSIISDEIYDLLLDILQLKNPSSSLLSNIGADIIKSKSKVILDYWMGSMNKFKYNSQQLNIWKNKYYPPYIISDKLDGVSALLIYSNNKINMITRGNGSIGVDISNLLKYINNIPSINIINKYCNKYSILGTKNIIAFRGELIIKKDIFISKWQNKFKNARNMIAGVVNSKIINKDIAEDIELVIYEIIDPLLPLDKQLKIIKDLSLITVYYKIITSVIDYKILSDILIERKQSSPYFIDGIVISVNKYERNINGNPEYAFAYKETSEDQITQSVIEFIEWKISKDGFLIPTIHIKPVTLNGVVIKKTTGFNGKYIVDNKLGPGSIIEIIRSGDVIPYITKIIKSSDKPQLPKLKWSWSETGVDMIIDNIDSNEDVKIKNIYRFFSYIGTKGLGEKTIQKMYNNNLDSIEKILKASEHDLIQIDGIQEKSAKNIILAIKESLIDIPLAKLFVSSNKFGHGLGEERFKQILINYPNILTSYSKWTTEDFIKKIQELNGWEKKTATQFVNNFSNFINFYKIIKKYIKLKSNNKNINENSNENTNNSTINIINKIFVFSGFRDKLLENKIIENKGIIANTITKSTSYLVIKDEMDLHTEKIKKAKLYNIPIIIQKDLNKLLLLL
jgi:NAD-dependent DNA ligase